MNEITRRGVRVESMNEQRNDDDDDEGADADGNERKFLFNNLLWLNLKSNFCECTSGKY